MFPRLPLLTACIVLTACTSLAAAQHLGDVWVGHSAAGQIAIHPGGFVPDLNYHQLYPVSGLLRGWTDADPGYDHFTSADPNSDILPLQSGAQVWLQVVAIDAAFRLIDSAFNILDTAGQSTYLGGFNLHVHNTWHINSSDPAFDPQQCVWRITVYLHDAGTTGYADSAPMTFAFTNVAVRPVTQPATDDFDGSGGVGPADWRAAAECFSGPGLRPTPDNPAITACEVTCLNAFDFDNDLDLDLTDFAAFQRLYTGN
jgi:hypothetical protein